MGYLFDPANWEWVFAGRNFMFLLERFLINIVLALITMALSLILGLVIALLRISKNKVTSAATGIWIDIWRNLPVLLILLYFGLAYLKRSRSSGSTSHPASSRRRSGTADRSSPASSP